MSSSRWSRRSRNHGTHQILPFLSEVFQLIDNSNWDGKSPRLSVLTINEDDWTLLIIRFALKSDRMIVGSRHVMTSIFFSGSFFGTLHEAGHGIYEQGLRSDQYGLPLGQYCSLGIHESQSRLWENLVGRSDAFWQHFYPSTQQLFSESLGDVSRSKFYRAINAVEPSLIRVEADEATYNLHIVIRFELERDLMNENLAIGDLPGAWNEKYQRYLGIDVPNDAQGVLQDVHWSAGLFGYFPTYTLGNLYAAQFFHAAAEELGDLNQSFARGEFDSLKRWLKSNTSINLEVVGQDQSWDRTLPANHWLTCD